MMLVARATPTGTTHPSEGLAAPLFLHQSHRVCTGTRCSARSLFDQDGRRLGTVSGLYIVAGAAAPAAPLHRHWASAVEVVRRPKEAGVHSGGTSAEEAVDVGISILLVDLLHTVLERVPHATWAPARSSLGFCCAPPLPPPLPRCAFRAPSKRPAVGVCAAGTSGCSAGVFGASVGRSLAAAPLLPWWADEGMRKVALPCVPGSFPPLHAHVTGQGRAASSPRVATSLVPLGARTTTAQRRRIPRPASPCPFLPHQPPFFPISLRAPPRLPRSTAHPTPPALHVRLLPCPPAPPPPASPGRSPRPSLHPPVVLLAPHCSL